MRSLRNLLWFAVGVLLIALPMFSFAAVTYGMAGKLPTYSSPQAACAAYGYSGSGGYWGPFSPHPEGACFNTGNPSNGNLLDVYGACDGGKALDPTTGMCPALPPPVDCSSGKPTDFWFDTGPLGNNSKVPTNDGYCGLSVVPKPAISQCYPTATGPTGHVMCHYIGARDGTPAPDGSAPPAPAPAADTPMPPTPVKVQGDSNGTCPGGTSLVGYDSSNIPMCVGSGTDPGKAPSTVGTNPTVTKTNPDGSTTTTDSTASTNSDGSQTTRTATCTIATNGGKSCTTTTATGSTPIGAQGKNDTDPKTGDDTKGDNPTSLDGELYGKGTKTMQDVMSHWTTSVSGAPFIGAAQTFLTAQVNSGSCPSWTASIPYLKITVDVGQYFCAPGIIDMFNIAGIGVMLGAAFVAFRIAFL